MAQLIELAPPHDVSWTEIVDATTFVRTVEVTVECASTSEESNSDSQVSLIPTYEPPLSFLT